jgi:hypothetical protein
VANAEPPHPVSGGELFRLAIALDAIHNPAINAIHNLLNLDHERPVLSRWYYRSAGTTRLNQPSPQFREHHQRDR